MSRRPSTKLVNADAPVFGPFGERATADMVAVSAVLLLTAALAGMSLIALVAIFGRLAS